MAIGVKLTPNKVGDKLHRMAAQTRPAIRNTINTILVTAESNVVKRTHVGATGTLRGAYATTPATLSFLQGSVDNPILYHDWVEEGRMPGRMPPVEALIPWVGTVLGIPVEQRPQVAFAVARQIARFGTKPGRQVEKGWAATKRRVKPELVRAGLKITRELHR